MRFFVQSSFPPVALALVLLFFLSGCLAGKTPATSPIFWELGLPFGNGGQSPSFYLQETKRWQVALKQAPGPQQTAEAHLHLAALALTGENPQKDYHQGYLELAQATTAWPELQKNMAIVSWLDLLCRLETETMTAQENIAGLEGTVARLKDQNATQRQELVKLREILDKLQRLELSVERKRRSLK